MPNHICQNCGQPTDMHEGAAPLQKLVDICYEMVLLTTCTGQGRDGKAPANKWFKGKTTEEIAGWVTEQLRECGFDTEPLGAKWGQLKDGQCPHKKPEWDGIYMPGIGLRKAHKASTCKPRPPKAR